MRLDAAYAIGSSIVPQKRNPYAAEMVRGEAARMCGALHTLPRLVKGLPLACDCDPQ